MALPLYPLFDPRWQLSDEDGEPLPGAKLYTYQADGITPQSVYTSSAGSTAHANPVVADADGRFPAMFLLPTGYSFAAKTSADVSVWTFTNLTSALTYFATLGNVLAEGNKNQASGYTVLTTDNFVSISTGGSPSIVNLPAASSRGLPLIIQNKNEGVVLRITPNGSDTINSLSTFYATPAAASPAFPTVILLSDGVSNWLIAGGIACG